MIGNDLVDLTAAAKESHWQRQGYLQKLYNSAEQSAILAAGKPDEYIWTLWSMKEAAYKIHSRRTGDRKFAPVKLEASDLQIHGSETIGMIRTEQSHYYTKTIIRKKYIYSIAAENPDLLRRIYTQLYFRPVMFDYHKYHPACVTHHGDYLALAFSH